jgi:hypothetical protein
MSLAENPALPPRPLTGATSGGVNYAVGVAAASAREPEPRQVRPPFADASPAEVRAALIPEDAVKFDRQWRAVMAAATETLDLTEVHDILDSWRRVAWLTQANGAEGYRELLARAEHRLRTGEMPAGGMTIEEVKAMIAERLRRRPVRQCVVGQPSSGRR